MPLELKIHEKTLKKFKRQRSCWIKIGTIFVPLLAITILEWDEITSLGHHLWLLASLIIALIGAGWWFWTMSILRTLIDYRILEVQILRKTVDDIKSVHDDFKKLK